MKELDNMKTERYGELKQIKVQQPIKVNDNEMDIINNSMNELKQWSNKNICNVIFDSKVDGYGSNNILRDIVLNRSNLYFIIFDINDNVFGGYLNVKISSYWINDKNAFIFSLIKDGNVKNTKYPIKLSCSGKAFYLCNSQDGCLYQFGMDIGVKRIGDKGSWYKCHYYDYNNEQNSLIDTTHSENFQAKRIIVIEMN